MKFSPQYYIAAIQQKIETDTAWCRQAVENAARAIQDAAEVELALQAADISYQRYGNTVEVVTPKERLTAVYKVLGRLKATGEKSVIDSRKREVLVYLDAVNHPSVRVKYLTKLPRGVKCKIKKVAHGGGKKWYSSEVVCGV